MILLMVFASIRQNELRSPFRSFRYFQLSLTIFFTEIEVQISIGFLITAWLMNRVFLGHCIILGFQLLKFALEILERGSLILPGSAFGLRCLRCLERISTRIGPRAKSASTQL